MSLFSRSIISFALGAALIGLSGCTIAYDVEVLLRDGRVTFDMSYSRIILGRDDACIEELTVRQVSDEQRISWQLRALENECPVVRYLAYGVTPAGVKTTVRPAKLKAGQLYTVTLRALGGWGRKTFVLLPRDNDVYGRIATIP
jgi:hypothetical protein